MQHFWRVRSASCHRSCESVVHCHSTPLPQSGHHAYTSLHAVNERSFFSSAKGVTLRESPLSLAKSTKTRAPRQCQRQTICPQQPNISVLTSNDDDVDQSWKQGSFHWFLPRMASDQKNGGSALDAPRFAGRKEWPLKLFSSSWPLFERKLCSPFAPKHDPPWPRLDSAVSNSPLRATRSCALCNDQMLEKLNERRMRMRWNTAVIDRENVLARSERTCRWF